MINYYLSVDLGQANDYTALSILEKKENRGFIRHLERLPLGMSYPDQVTRIKGLYQELLKFRSVPVLVVDFTGVGRAVSDLLTKEQLRHIKLTITGGNDANIKGDEWHVPKQELISALLVSFQTGQLRISDQLPLADTMIKELINFKMRMNPKTKNISFEGRDGVNDDLVLSLSQACYISGLGKPAYSQISRPTPGNNRGIPVKPKPGIGFFEPRNRSRGIVGL